MTKSTNSEIAVLQTEVKNIGTRMENHERLLREVIAKIDKLTIAQTEIHDLRREVANLKTEITELKGTNTLKNTLLWVGLVASAIINVIVIYQLYGG